MKARNLILSESAETFTVYGKAIEVLTYPHAGGFLAVAYLEDGRQVAGAPGATEMDTKTDLRRKLDDLLKPQFDPAKTYEAKLAEAMTRTQATDIFQRFGVPRADRLNKKSLQQAWRKLSHQWHPDKPGGSTRNEQEINAAYDVLRTEPNRVNYAAPGWSSVRYGDGPTYQAQHVDQDERRRYFADDPFGEPVYSANIFYGGPQWEAWYRTPDYQQGRAAEAARRQGEPTFRVTPQWIDYFEARATNGYILKLGGAIYRFNKNKCVLERLTPKSHPELEAAFKERHGFETVADVVTPSPEVDSARPTADWLAANHDAVYGKGLPEAVADSLLDEAVLFNQQVYNAVVYWLKELVLNQDTPDRANRSLEDALGRGHPLGRYVEFSKSSSAGWLPEQEKVSLPYWLPEFGLRNSAAYLEFLQAELAHELVHGEQQKRAGAQHMIRWAKAAFDPVQYHSHPFELMANAKPMSDVLRQYPSIRSNVLVPPEIIKHGGQKASNRFHKYLYQYAQESAMPLDQAMAQATAEILADPKAVSHCGQEGKPGYRKGRPVHPYDINCGYCEDWASRVEALVPGAEALGAANLTGNPDDDLEYPHVFIRYQGRYYDAETPQGVTVWRQLPPFQQRRREDVVEAEQEWTAEQPKTHCHHNWFTVNVEERPGYRKLTQQCPHCGQQRVLDRRVLPKLPRQPMTQRPPKATCHHIWMGAGEQVNAEGTIRRYTHICPKCNKTRVVHRRILPLKPSAGQMAERLLDS